MIRDVCVWENDLTDEIDSILYNFIQKRHNNCNINVLSGLKQRDISEIWDSIKNNGTVVIQPSLFDMNQVREIVKSISHGIWINFHSNTNNLDLRTFEFLSMDPYKDLKEIVEICKGLKDAHNELSLVKIVKCIDVNFYGFDGEHYQLRTEGYWGDFIAIRHK